MKQVTIVICTMDRPQLLFRCLQKLLKQTNYFTDVLVVEDVTLNQSLSLPKLKKLFRSHQINCHYQAVKFTNIAKSRQKALELVKNGILIFIDDDVIIGRNSLRITNQNFNRDNQLALLTGKMLPIKKNLISEIDFVYFNQGTLKLKNRSTIKNCPFSFIALNVSLIYQNSIDKKNVFDPTLHIGEDIDYSLNLSLQNYKMLFDPRLINFHDFDLKLNDFLQKKYTHGKYIFLLYQKHGQYFSSQNSIFVTTNLMAAPNLLITSIKSTNRYLHLYSFSLIQGMIILLGEIATNFGILSAKFHANHLTAST